MDENSDDDEFFTSTASSNLAKIFGMPSSAPIKVKEKFAASQQSLRYMPQQKDINENDTPQETDSKEIAKPDWALIVVKIVTAYKLVSRENVLQGKLGLALLKLDEQYKIILYRTKTEVLDTIEIRNESKMFIKDDYFQFQSDSDQFWSILFEKKSDRDCIFDKIEDICIIKIQLDFNDEKPKTNQTDIKASIISRMAKVGQPVFINKNKRISTSDETSGEENETVATPKPVIMTKKPTLSPVHNIKISQNQEGNAQMMLTENRIQNTEIRINISKLDTKLDRILDKIDLLNLQCRPNLASTENEMEEEIMKLEEKILHLKKENLLLKNKIGILDGDLKNMIVKTKTNVEHEQQIEILNEKVEASEKNIENMKRLDQEKDTIVENLNKEMVQKDKTIEELQKEISELKIKDNSIVKDIISNSFQKICDSIDNEKIRKLVGQILKQETNKMLKE